jgi:hypothetical protein
MNIESNLNNDWIINFDKMDKIYKDYYKDDLYYINLNFIYINKNNEIQKIKQEYFLMTTPNYILREEIIEILKKNMYDNNCRYSLLSILKYNITLDTNNVSNFLKDDIDTDYLTIINNVDSIKFEKTIHMFQDLNDVIFIFNEKSNEVKKNNDNATKKNIKTVIHTKNTKTKNTIKKRYKD